MNNAVGLPQFTNTKEEEKKILEETHRHPCKTDKEDDKTIPPLDTSKILAPCDSSESR